MDERLQEIVDRTEKLQSQAQEVLDKADGASAEEREGFKSQLAEIAEKLEPLQVERDERLRQLELDEMKASVGTLEETITALKEDAPNFRPTPPANDEDGEKAYGPDGEFSWYGDVVRARNGDQKAYARLEENGSPDMKAMTEGTDSAGGFLVNPTISSELIELRLQSSVLRSLFSSVGVTSDTLQFAAVTAGLTAGWVAELATKPAADLAFGTISASVFTAAGLAVVSNQLLKDSSVDTLINADLARRLAIVEEVAFINGSGSGQPRGILNTSGVNAEVYTDASPTVLELLDKITDAITDIHTNFFAAPDAIVMHPRTWAYIVKAREATAPSTYIIGGAGSSAWGRRPGDPIPGYTAGLPRGELFGLPVYTTANVPTNLGAGTNESAVIVGAFREGLVLDREGITTDQSEHVYFTSNQTVFRAEERLGFTAARYPKAFSVVTGTGLIGV